MISPLSISRKTTGKGARCFEGQKLRNLRLSFISKKKLRSSGKGYAIKIFYITDMMSLKVKECNRRSSTNFLKSYLTRNKT